MAGGAAACAAFATALPCAQAQLSRGDKSKDTSGAAATPDRSLMPKPWRA